MRNFLDKVLVAACLLVLIGFTAYVIEPGIVTAQSTQNLAGERNVVVLGGTENTVKKLSAGTTSQIRTDARAGTVTALAGRRKIRLDDAHTFSSTSPQIVYAYLNTTTPTAAQGIPFWNGHPLELEVDDSVVVKWLIDGSTPSVIITQFAD